MPSGSNLTIEDKAKGGRNSSNKGGTRKLSTPITPEVIDKFIQLVEEGHYPTQAKKILGLSRGAIHNHFAKDEKLMARYQEARRQGPINKMDKTIEGEEIASELIVNQLIKWHEGGEDHNIKDIYIAVNSLAKQRGQAEVEINQINNNINSTDKEKLLDNIDRILKERK